MKRALLIATIAVGTFLAGGLTAAAFLLLDHGWHELEDTP